MDGQVPGLDVLAGGSPAMTGRSRRRAARVGVESVKLRMGADLCRRRVELGLSQQQVADRAGVSLRTLVSVESSASGHTLTTLAAILASVGMVLCVKVPKGAAEKRDEKDSAGNKAGS